MKLWVLTMLVCVTAIQIDIYGDDTEIDNATVIEARKYLMNHCLQNVKITGLDFYESRQHRYSGNLKITIEDKPCVLDNAFNKRRMRCVHGPAELIGSSVTYVKKSMCSLGSEVSNLIATHIPTRKNSKVSTFITHLEMALKAYKDNCEEVMEPICERVKTRTDTPHVRKGSSRGADSDNSQASMEITLTDTDPEEDLNPSSTTTISTTTMNDTEEDVYYVTDTPDDTQSDLSLGNYAKFGDGNPDVFSKIKKLAENLQAILEGLDEESGFVNSDMVIVACICVSCLLILGNIILQCAKNRPNALRRDIQQMNELTRNLQRRLWSTPESRNYV